MSIFLEEEENELVNFENLEILDLFEDDSEIESAECIDINNDKKKIILIKMRNIEKTNNSTNKKNSKKSKSQKKDDEEEEEIHELKYNLYLGLFRDCVPAIEECKEIIKNRNLVGQRVIIQKVEMNKEQKIFHPKKYIFIPPNGNKELLFEIEKNKVLKITKDENITMELGTKDGEEFKKEKDLIEFDDITGPDIVNQITTMKNEKSSKNKESPLENSTTINSEYDNQQNKININLDKKDESSESKNSELGIGAKSDNNNSKNSNNSKLSRLDYSSENELEQGKLFYDVIENGTKYMKYSYLDSFKKEIDGIYYHHSDINLGIGKKELNLDKYKKYQEFEEDYNSGDNNNDLHGYIIMKNFDETKIPKDTPFIIEIKAGFDFIKLLKQIKKAAKYVNNMKNCSSQLPKYFIGILCSFNKYNIMGQFNQLNTLYNGSDPEDKANSKLLNHITKIINLHQINFVIAVIKDGKINGYDLGEEDYDILFDGKKYIRIDLGYMYKTINKNPEPNDSNKLNEKIKSVSNNFAKVYKTFNKLKTIEIPFIEKIEKDKKIKELEQKLKNSEGTKQNKDNLIKEENKIEEKKNYEEEMKKIEEERKKMLEEEKKRKKMLEEEMMKIEEERKKMSEEEKKRKKIREEEEKKMKKMFEDQMIKLEEERKKMHEEEKKRKKMFEDQMKKIEEERKKMHEEEMKKKEDRAKNEQDSEYHKEKK